MAYISILSWTTQSLQSELVTFDGGLEAGAGLTTGAGLGIALPGGGLDGRGTPGRLVAKLAAGRPRLKFRTRLATFLLSGGRVAVHLANRLTPRRTTVSILTPCNRKT